MCVVCVCASFICIYILVYMLVCIAICLYLVTSCHSLNSEKYLHICKYICIYICVCVLVTRFVGIRQEIIKPTKV